MPPKLAEAAPEDALAIVDLRNAVADDLGRRYGKGHWCHHVTINGVLLSMKRGRVYIARHRNRLVATLTLSKRKPWAIDRTYFTPCKTPLYLTEMAVSPSMQHKGIGRSMLSQAVVLAEQWPADSICLDAYDAEAGAGEFYRKCGFEEVGRVIYRTVPLIYYEQKV